MLNETGTFFLQKWSCDEVFKSLRLYSTVIRQRTYSLVPANILPGESRNSPAAIPPCGFPLSQLVRARAKSPWHARWRYSFGLRSLSHEWDMPNIVAGSRRVIRFRKRYSWNYRGIINSLAEESHSICRCVRVHDSRCVRQGRH